MNHAVTIEINSLVTRCEELESVLMFERQQYLGEVIKLRRTLSHDLSAIRNVTDFMDIADQSVVIAHLDRIEQTLRAFCNYIDEV